MKPLNLDNRPCSPISSNCVIWQGPDIPCIKLCTGDTVSDVVAKLGAELCTIMEQLNVTNYDLSCLDLASCPPSDFKALMELLIKKICELNGLPTDTTKSTSACPDCVVSVAPCFVQGTQTTMQLVDYVQMIANRVCSIIDQIAAINNELVIINDTLVDLQYQIDNIPVYTLPSIPANCILAPGSYPLDQILNALMNDGTLGYCSLLNATGTPAEIINGVLSQCIADGDASLASKAAGDSPVQSFSTYYAGSWVNNPSLTADPTVANALKNVWIAICDIYTYVENLSLNVQDTNTVNLTYSGGTLTAAVQDTGWVRLLGFAYIPDNNSQMPPMVRRIGNVLHFRGTVIVPLNNGGSALTWTYGPGNDSYFAQTSVAPFGGTGGVYVNTNGSVVFNYTGVGTTCDSVIPASVLPAGYVIDAKYQNPAGWKVASRAIPIDDDNSTILTTLFSQVISADGTLTLGMVRDAEATTVSGQGGTNSYDTSHLNYIISHVTGGQKVPKFASSQTTIYDTSVPLGGQQSLEIDFYPSSTYPFSCNANSPFEVGGFLQRLDGLTAFISPCGATIPTPDPCPKG